VLTSGDYALVPFAGGWAYGVHTCSPVALINDRTGTKTLLRHSTRTEVLAFGAPWILFDESGAGNSDTVLYNIATHKTARLNRCGIACSEMNKEPMSYRLGSRWLAITFQHYAPCGDGIHDSCGGRSVTYYNVITHQVRVDVTTTPETT